MMHLRITSHDYLLYNPQSSHYMVRHILPLFVLIQHGTFIYEITFKLQFDYIPGKRSSHKERFRNVLMLSIGTNRSTAMWE